jgi:uncharacterized membrane protein YphA (DoxX/SURF4 family)
MLRRLLTTTAPTTTVLIRLMIGAVFLSEGIQKFLYPGQIGTGRCAKIGLPSPDILGPLVGSRSMRNCPSRRVGTERRSRRSQGSCAFSVARYRCQCLHRSPSSSMLAELLFT